MDHPTIISLTDADFHLDSILPQITLPTTGASVLFTGIVREQTINENARETVYLQYEAYQPMAETKMRQIADEIRQKWPTIEGIAIIQRTGRVFPGTPSTLIACTASHRNTGIFEAARYGIDRLKEIVPVWKKETGPRGEEWVEGQYIPKPGE
jgi:molybdopterin synthase catalytic subunit